jgi:hypothetical protein
MSPRLLSRVVLFILIPTAAMVLAAGCSKTPSPEASAEPEPVAQLETPPPPVVEMPAVPVSPPSNPALAADRPLVEPEEPATSAPPTVPSMEASSALPLPTPPAPAPQMTPGLDSAASIAPVEPPPASVAAPLAPTRRPVQDPVSATDEPGPRPNPLRGGQQPTGSAHMTVRPSEPPATAGTANTANVADTANTAEPSDRPRPKRKGKHSGERFDPVKVNGAIFEGWTKPRFALVISGRQDGYVEPCGCAGLDWMKGGLTRRYSFLEKLRNDGWPVVAVDVGGQCKTFGRQAVLKYQMTVEALKQMDYSAVAYGTNDLRLPAGEVLAVTAATPGQSSPFISANVALFGFAAEMTGTKRIVEAGGKKIGITAVLGKKYQKEINNPQIEMIDPEQALSKLVPELKKGCDVLVLLAHATVEEADELGRRFPEFQVVVTYGGPAEPPATPQTIEGTDRLLVEVGEKGMNVIVRGFYDDPKPSFRPQRVPLDSRFDSAPSMKLLMANYQTQLRTEGLEGLGIRPVTHPKKDLLGAFVGSHKCESCHDESYKVWKKSGHAKAWDTLKKADPPRDPDPECIACHVVGWNAAQFFPYESGFLNEKDTPKLVDVGCESCHGPGQKHIEAEMGSNEALQKRLREAMVVTKEESEKRQCYTCHDLENSPDFDFKTYWPYIEHKEE